MIKQPEGTSTAFLDDTDRYFDGSRAEPNEGFIEAIVTTALYSNTFRPADQTRDEAGHGRTMLQGGLFREANNFVPPEHLLPKDRITAGTKRFLRVLVDMIISEAQKNHVHKPEIIEALMAGAGSSITKVYPHYAISNHAAHTYFHLDTGGTRTPEAIAAEVQKMVDNIRDAFRVALRTLLKDPMAMKEMVRTAQVDERVFLDVHMKDDVTRVDALREQTEKPEEKELFVKMLKEAVKVLGFSDDELDVGLLDTKDALFLMANGLYTPGKGSRFLRGDTIPSARSLRDYELVIDVDGKYKRKLLIEGPDGASEQLVELEDWQMHGFSNTPNPDYVKPRVSIPMSHYGTRELMEMEKVWEILAHEVAHHQINELYKVGRNDEKQNFGEGGKRIAGISWKARELGESHHQLHNILTQMNLARLRAMKFKFKTENGRPVDVEVAEGFDPEAALKAAKNSIDGRLGKLEKGSKPDTTELRALVERATQAAANLDARMEAIRALPPVVVDASIPGVTTARSRTVVAASQPAEVAETGFISRFKRWLSGE